MAVGGRHRGATQLARLASLASDWGQNDAESQAAAQQQDLQEQQALNAQAAQQQVAPPPAGLGGSQIVELTKLAALRDQGTLTDAEFAAEKAKILR